MDAVLKELQTIVDAKLGLELEIAAYRKLLEGEEARYVATVTDGGLGEEGLASGGWGPMENLRLENTDQKRDYDGSSADPAIFFQSRYLVRICQSCIFQYTIPTTNKATECRNVYGV